MAVICITRELAAMGEETARELARIGGYRYIEKDYIESKLAEHKIGAEVLQQYDEKKPGLWASMSQNRDRYLHFLKAVVYDEAARGKCIILGRGSNVLLYGIPGVLCIRIVAPYKVRVGRVKIAFGYDDRTADHHIRQSDHDKLGFHKYFFETDWNDSSLYDLTLNTGRISPEAAAETIEKFLKLTVTPAAEKEGEARIEDLRLKTAVFGEIIFTQRIEIQSLMVESKEGKVTLSGFAISGLTADSACEAAGKIPGVKDVVNEIQVMPPVTVG